MGLYNGNLEQTNQHAYAGRNLWSGILFGLGLIAFIDEAVFHQLLGWHHFYDRSTTQVGIFSDGLFHAFSWFATVGALFMVADLRRRNAWWPMRWMGGVLLGAGAFNLYDGVVQHKLMRIHQIRYNVDNLFIYDAVWIGLSLIVLVCGIFVISKTQKTLKRERADHA